MRTTPRRCSSPRSGRLYIATKELKGGLYRAPKKPSADGVNKLTRVGDAPATITDGLMLPGGKQIAYLTYAKVARRRRRSPAR